MLKFHPVDGAGPATEASLHILPYIIARYRLRSVIDLGCNAGYWLAQCLQLGIDDVLGVDGDNMLEHLVIPETKFCVGDLRYSIFVDRVRDLAICVEVAEHVPEEYGDVLINTICSVSQRVLWSAAPPGQTGYQHINCQTPTYWRSKFLSHGWEEDEEVAAFARTQPIIWYYRDNLTAYRSKVPH